MNVFEIFLKSNFLMQIIILILVTCSIFSWGIIIYQIYIFNFIKQETVNFENKFKSEVSLSKLYENSQISIHILRGTEKIFYSGFQKFSQLYYNNCTNNYPLQEILKETMRVMRVSIHTEIKELGKYIIFLGMISSISPYIGLFGTILGIIHVFFELGSIKYITLQTIAPGFSESLIFSAGGLFVSISSTISFYYSNLCINNIEEKYLIFLEEFISILQKQTFVNKD